MPRPTLRNATLIFFSFATGLLVCYHGYRRSDPSYPSDGQLKRESNQGSDSIHDTKSYTTRARVGVALNSTTMSAGGGQRCRRLWQKGKSEWFDQKFNDSLLPVWMKENKKLPSEIEKWWMTLQGNKDKDYIGALNKAFEVIPNPTRFLAHNMSRCLRCAVVGNSGNLKDSGYGPAIDAHDAVIRINQAKVKGFEKDVGKRETHRLMYPESFMDIPKDTHFVLLNFKVIDIKWARSAITTGEITKTYANVKRMIKVTPSKILFYNPALMFHIHRDWIDRKGRYPSSGTLAVFFAIQFCDEVSVYGMGANSKGYWDHYWQAGDGAGNSAFLKTHVHDSVHEFDLIKKLDEEKVITLYKGVR